MGPFPTSPVRRIYTIDPQDPTRSGRNPRGIALDASGHFAYVTCPTTAMSSSPTLDAASVVQRIRSSEAAAARQPGGGDSPRQDRFLHVAAAVVGSRLGQLCALSSRWPQRRRHLVVRGGPRQTSRTRRHVQHTTIRKIHRALNWTPVRDENQDFELNTRGVFGGAGFITGQYGCQRRRTDAGLGPQRAQLRAGELGSGAANKRTSPRSSGSASGSAIAPPSTSRQHDARSHHLRLRRPGTAPTASPVTAGGKWTTSRITYDPSDVNPVPMMDTGIGHSGASGSRRDGMIDVSEAKAALGVPERIQFRPAGAGRIGEVPPPPPGVDVAAPCLGTAAASCIRSAR
jgi:hypothetical protein